MVQFLLFMCFFLFVFLCLHVGIRLVLVLWCVICILSSLYIISLDRIEHDSIYKLGATLTQT